MTDHGSSQCQNALWGGQVEMGIAGDKMTYDITVLMLWSYLESLAQKLMDTGLLYRWTFLAPQTGRRRVCQLKKIQP